MKNTIYIIIGVILLLVGFILVFSSLIHITRSFVCLMEIFTHFSESDLRKIIRYCQFLSRIFVHLGHKYDKFKLPYSEEALYNSGGTALKSNVEEINNDSMSRGNPRRPSTIQGQKLEMGISGFSSHIDTAAIN